MKHEWNTTGSSGIFIIKQRDKVNTHTISELALNSTLNFNNVIDELMVENFLFKHKEF